MNINSKTSNLISRSQVLEICNILRSLGLTSGLTGTRILNKAIQIISIKDLEIIVLEDIYKELSLYFPNLKPANMRFYISYALNNRNSYKSENNFKKIFGFEYDEIYFEPKNFIEEVANIIRIEVI